MAKIYTIIVTYNGEKWIRKCLEQLTKSLIPTKILLIDNASSDNTIDILKSFKPEADIQIFLNEKNMGFGQANNIGIEYALKEGADFIFLLNQDAYVFPDTISQLVLSLKTNPRFGILSPLQLEASGQNIEPTFNRFLKNNFHENTIQNFINPEDNTDLNKPLAMRFVNAAAWMISRDCINKTGLFHPVFFHYGEDNHYASRVQYHNLKIGVLPAAQMIHDCAATEKDSRKLLLRQIVNVPLYTLLDIRKFFPMAYLLGLQKWNHTKNKLKRFKNPADIEKANELKKWFWSNLSQAVKIRRETKREWKKEAIK